jgi:cyclase
MPCLLLQDGSLVKTIRFKDPDYIGDPINAISIYNEKEVDELIFLDITATPENKSPAFKTLAEIASECFMPVTYGGGLRTLEDMKAVFNLGVEKIAINSYAGENPHFIHQAAERFGSQSIVISIDVKKLDTEGYVVYTHGGTKATGLHPVEYANQMEAHGAGEILLTSIDRDGTQQGYDIDLIKQVTEHVTIPVIASGGAGKVDDFGTAIKQGGASACAAGSMVVFFGRNRAVLINFPDRQELVQVLV